MKDDDLYISPSSDLEDTITLSSNDFYDWDPDCSTLDVTTISSAAAAASTVTLNSNAYPWSTIATNGILTTSSITGASVNPGYGAVPPSVNIWADNSSITEPSGHIDLKGENADITINGRSLGKTIQALEERLNMLRPNEHLEAEWDQLRELGEAYRKLEADLAEKQRAWEILKK